MTMLTATAEVLSTLECYWEYYCLSPAFIDHNYIGLRSALFLHPPPKELRGPPRAS